MTTIRQETTKRLDRNELTPRQREVLQFVAGHIDNHGYAPTQREICKFLKVTGTLPAAKHLAALEKKGYLKLDPVSRGIALTAPANRSVALPIAGTVRAGQLTTAVQDVAGYFSVDQSVAKGDGCFFLRVAGDSMVDAGIFEGDLALVRPQPAADDGDTVVALVGDEATLKKFYRESGRVRLQPANAAMEPILVGPGDGDVSIIGKVIGVFRRLE